MNQSEPSIVVHVRCVSTDQPPATNHQPLVARRAFTLLELLVVIGIILLFASLGLTAIFRLGTVNRLAAAEQTIAGAIRQAKHTARSTGNPVLLEMETTANGESTIRGTVATVLWSERFEGTQGFGTPGDPLNFPLYYPVNPPTATAAKRLADRRAPDGWSGAALHLKNLDLSDPVGPLLTTTLDPLRGRVINENDGLMLEVKVLMSDPAFAWTPLVVVSNDPSRDHTDPPPVSSSAYGIAVRWQKYPRYEPTPNPAPPQEESGTLLPLGDAEIVEWCAWFGPDVISSWDDRPASLPTAMESDLTRRAEFINRVGSCDPHDWHAVQFIATKDRLVLLVDGVVVAARELSRSTIPIAATAAKNVYVGMAIIDGQLPLAAPRFHPTSSGTPSSDPVLMPPTTKIDDLRILRLGGGTAGRLPPGLSFAPTAPTAPIRLLCLPDGRVTHNGDIMAATGSTSHTIMISGSFDEAHDQAAITIRGDGTVSSELKRKTP
jgi:prepilin-type N-terminal cleavage/methylation domain-containing protein